MATAVVLGIGVAPPASAADNNQVVGIEESFGDPSGSEIAYTVTKILPSADPVAYPVAGQLYEASVMARAIRGTVTPVVPFFHARAEGGANYRVLADVYSLSGAPLGEGATTDGKVYFDVVGAVPNSIVYNGGPGNQLVWRQPIPGNPKAGGSTGSTGGGSRGVMDSTGPNEASPSTSAGDIGGGGGTEGGGGNLNSGGGSGAPNGDTGGNTGSGG